MTAERSTAPTNGSEEQTLLSHLTYHRGTLRLKCEGLSQEQLTTGLAPSTLTLGGLLKHAALCEDWWFSVVLLGNEHIELWRDVDWDADPDWEFRTAAEDSPEELFRLFDAAIEGSDANIRTVLDREGLGALSVRENHHRDEESHFNLRWILQHMIAEYARHNGHADLIRESIDGATGE